MTYEQVTELVMAEIERAKTKWPGWPLDPVHAAAVVAEESGELVQAAMRYYYEDGAVDPMVTEALHTAATAIRFIADTGRGYLTRGGSE